MRTRFTSRNALAVLCGTSVLCTMAGGVYAQTKLTSFTDVDAGAWYESASSDLLSSGALDASERQLRPNDFATRAEFVKLLVRGKNSSLSHPQFSSFNDVSTAAWYSTYFETAAQAGWIHGDRNCFNQFRPCYARPSSNVNRAEAAALLLRAFNLEHTGQAPGFTDNADQNAWYQLPIETAADHCILQGDAMSGRVRPSAIMNRAEMIVMFDRAMKNQVYGTDCGQTATTPYINGASADSKTTITLDFSASLVQADAESTQRYIVTERPTNKRIVVQRADLVDSNSVQLTLQTSMASHTTYDIEANNVSTRGGVTFSDSVTIVSPVDQTETTSIVSVEALTPSRLLITLSVDLDQTRAQDAALYEVFSRSHRLDVSRATLRDPRTVELQLSEDLLIQTNYTVSVNDLKTVHGTIFSDAKVFLYDKTTVSFSASLSGLKEVPSVATSGSGSATVMLDSNGAHYDIRVSSLSGSLIEAEFHRGSPGSNGPVLKTLGSIGNHATGTWSTLSNTDRQNLLDGLVYINIRTTFAPTGEIRGQVTRQ